MTPNKNAYDEARAEGVRHYLDTRTSSDRSAGVLATPLWLAFNTYQETESPDYPWVDNPTMFGRVMRQLQVPKRRVRAGWMYLGFTLKG
jgi:hypothetical protein